ncbi:proline dehydrogenase [Persicobacter psychrovividus]|uniref:Proline dehydrogenase n=2 Tax=Persicobacter psychrovividus TaxID=387638 RepID=A0ABN6LE57_9BACT|nr:proline dehydrogenase [Persicobacter psychrovividus]
MVEINPVNFSDTYKAFRSKSNTDLWRSYMLFKTINYPTVVNLGTSFVNVALKFRLPVKNIVKATLFKQFCGGESIQDSKNTIEELNKYRIGTILDYSVEGESTEEAFDATYRETLRTIEEAAENDKIPFCVFKPTGMGDVALWTKISNKETLNEVEKQSFKAIRQRFDGLCRAASESGKPILIDAEDSWYQDAVDSLVTEMMVAHNQDRPIVYNTFQMYRKNMVERMRRLHEIVKESGAYFGAKLVRGAYMEKEAERAEKYGYENPINPTKEATDNMYNDGLRYCMEHLDSIGLISCSHNEASAQLLIDLMQRHNLKDHDPRVCFAQLYGMSDHLSYNLSDHGYNVAKYVPYGPVEKVMPYLFRRAEENTSVAGQSSRELNLIMEELDRRKAK